MNFGRRDLLKLAAGAAALTVLPALRPEARASRAALRYRCLFNHELLILLAREDHSSAYVASFIEKLRDTDVDAVMCCPTAWRTNLFPSRVDPPERNHTPGRPSPKYPGYARIMDYIHRGGDPVRETHAACRAAGKAFFISYRMNDHHHTDDREWPTHNAIWREHPEYWLGDSDASPYSGSDDVRLFNYLRPEVRDYYFSILRELCVNYEVDGVELDFQRFPKFFRRGDLAEGRSVMTAFVRRIREMLDGLGAERGRSLSLCVRVPETLAKCEAAGLDVPGWDRAGLVDMVNVSSYYRHTIELGIEEYRSRLGRARIYGEMNYVTYQESRPGGGFHRRYTTPELYRGSACNLFARGVDGLSLFNFDYVPASQRTSMTAVLRGITDVELLRNSTRAYALNAGFALLPARDEFAADLVISDAPSRAAFQRSVLRVETREDCRALPLQAWLNGTELATEVFAGTELFSPIDSNPSYPPAERLQFFTVPIERIVPGRNAIRLANRERATRSCEFVSLELGIYR